MVRIYVILGGFLHFQLPYSMPIQQTEMVLTAITKQDLGEQKNRTKNSGEHEEQNGRQIKRKLNISKARKTRIKTLQRLRDANG